MNKKKNLIFLLTVFLMAVFISACGSSSDQSNDADNNDEDKIVDEEDNTDDEVNNSGDDDDSDENSEKVEEEGTSSNNDTEVSENNNSNEVSNENTNENSSDEENNTLSGYSSEEIEYARVWLQLGDTKDIDELNVKHISSGEPLNPDDETSIDYPENVVQLTSSRLAEVSITYSSNGDGTVKLYKKIPQRWDGKNPAGEDVYKEIIKDTEQESIDPGSDEKVKELIKKINSIS